MIEKNAFSISEPVKAGAFGRTTLYEAIRDGELVARKAGCRTIILDLPQYVIDGLSNFPGLVSLLGEGARGRAAPTRTLHDECNAQGSRRRRAEGRASADHQQEGRGRVICSCWSLI
jgi:hypothetical protein